MPVQTLKPLQFGWTYLNQPDYKLRLQPSDFNAETLEPGDEFVRKVAGKLSGDNDSDPRMAMIANAKEILGDSDRVHRFQDNLMTALAAHLKETNSPILRYHNPFESHARTHPRNRVQATVSNVQDNPFGRHARDGKSKSFLHWDYWDWPVLAVSYDDFTNVLGGVPRLFDARQMARDLGNPLQQFLEVVKSKTAGNGFFKINPEHLTPTLEEKYAIPFNPSAGSIVVFNNTFSAGVAHGPTTAWAIDRAQPSKRPMYHSSIHISKQKTRAQQRACKHKEKQQSGADAAS